jgi:hypothetical protein
MNQPLYWEQFASDLIQSIEGIQGAVRSGDRAEWDRALEAYRRCRDTRQLWGRAERDRALETNQLSKSQFDKFEEFVCRHGERIGRARPTPFLWKPFPRRRSDLFWSPALWALIQVCTDLVDPSLSESPPTRRKELRDALAEFDGPSFNVQCKHELNRLDAALAAEAGTRPPAKGRVSDRRGAPPKYPQAVKHALKMLKESRGKEKPTDQRIYNECKRKFGGKEPIPDKVDTFMRAVWRQQAKPRRRAKPGPGHN